MESQLMHVPTFDGQAHLMVWPQPQISQSLHTFLSSSSQLIVVSSIESFGTQERAREWMWHWSWWALRWSTWLTGDTRKRRSVTMQQERQQLRPQDLHQQQLRQERQQLLRPQSQQRPSALLAWLWLIQEYQWALSQQQQQQQIVHHYGTNLLPDLALFTL